MRERLTEGSTAEVQSSSGQAVVSEELPAPQATTPPPATAQPGNSLLEATQSVLENPGNSALPAAGRVPPAVAPSGSGAAAASDRRIYLGLEAEEVTGGGIGVRVTNVTQGSPAWKAGFEKGDRIMAIGGFAIANLDDMVQQLSKSAPGQSVKFLISRNERNIELVAILMEAGLAERIAGASLPIGDLSNPPVAGPAWLGVVSNDLSPAFRNQFGLTVFRGAAVTTVAAGSPAARSGIMAGDVITAIGGVPIETANELINWMGTARPGQMVDITYQRGSLTRTAKLTLEVSPSSRGTRAAARPGNQDAGRPAPPNSSLYNVAPGTPVTPNVTGDNNPQVASGPNPQLEIVPSTGLVPNSIPKPTTSVPPETVDVVALQREIAQLKAELEKANQRLESTQNRLKQILDGLGNN